MNLKTMRARMGLTQKGLAEIMNTTQQTIARWETGKTPLNAEHIKDLCVLLQCTADELLGREATQSDKRYGPFSAGQLGLPFGTLTLQLATGARDYPIDVTGKESLERMLRTRFSTSGGSRPAGWIDVWTLDNNVLLINPAALTDLRLVSDDIEEMPRHDRPEVYRALVDWHMEQPAPGPLRDACVDVIEWLGEDEAISRASDLRVHWMTGAVRSFPLSEATATGLFEILVHGGEVSQQAFLMVEDEEAGADRAFINLEPVALIEVPMDLYSRMIA